MNKIYITSILCFAFFTTKILAQKQDSIKNGKEIVDTLNKFYSNFYLDGKQTASKEISYKLDTPTKSKNNIQLSDSVFRFTISHSNNNNLTGTIIIEIDVAKKLYMVSSIYHENINKSHHGFDSRSLGWWEEIKEVAPNYIYPPQKLLNLLSK